MTPSFVFLGYLPKRLVPRPEWLACPGVEFVANVSECISPALPDRIKRWEHSCTHITTKPSFAKFDV